LDKNEEEQQYGPFELAITDEASAPIDNNSPIAVGDKVSLDLYPRANSGINYNNSYHELVMF
jgi:hypothetical protein